MYEFMYFLFLNTLYLLFLTIKLFLCFYSLLFRDMSFAISINYDLMIFIYNPKELKLSPKMWYK